MKVRILKGETSVVVFEELRKSGRISGAELAEKAGISRTAVWKAIEKIRNSGYCVEAVKGVGYTLTSEPEIPVYELASLCFSRGVEEFYYFETVDSTNTFLKKLVSERGVKAFAIAKTQTSGRGRLGRKWFSDEGGLYFSLSSSFGAGVDSGFGVEDVPKVTLCAGVAVCKALRKFADVYMKWPNDVMLNGKKVCGILCELVGETERLWVIVGVGINVRNRVQDVCKETCKIRATSLWEEGVRVSLKDVSMEVISSLFDYLSTLPEDWEKIRKEWLEMAKPMLGRTVEVTSAGVSYRGIARGIDERGALILESGEKTIRVFSGDCFYGR